jgi:tRNA-splicing ligase RtcB
MNVLLDFAYLNRQIMIEDVIKNMLHYFPHMKNAEMNFDGATKEFQYGKLINIHHNYASLESHMGKNLWIHRKGAVLARKGVLGIIPGSQSTNSFITIGNGNNLSLNSSSHGSGRKMGRKQAQRELSLEKEIEIIFGRI